MPASRRSPQPPGQRVRRAPLRCLAVSASAWVSEELEERVRSNPCTRRKDVNISSMVPGIQMDMWRTPFYLSLQPFHQTLGLRADRTDIRFQRRSCLQDSDQPSLGRLGSEGSPFWGRLGHRLGHQSFTTLRRPWLSPTCQRTFAGDASMQRGCMHA